MSFALTGKESIVIYGAGTQGKKFIEIFHKNGFRIKAVLDRNAEAINTVTVDNLTVRVILPEQYVMESRDEVAIISLWNALWHEKILEVLCKIGFNQIIFLPTSMSGNKKMMSVMRKTFNEILDGNTFIDNIPEYEKIYRADTNVYDLGENYIYVPIEILFSEENFQIPIEKLNGSEQVKRFNVMKTSGENMANLKSYLHLYRYLDKGIEGGGVLRLP